MKFCIMKGADHAFLRCKERDACAARPDPWSGRQRPPRRDQSWLTIVGLLVVFCACVTNCFSLDREAFTFTNYDFTAQIDTEQHRLGVRGKITLRNDSQTQQRSAVLQISSSLAWRSISLSGKAGDKPVQFLTQPYTSDIDHTGSLSEAIVTLPQPVPPQGTLELDIAYEGLIVRDATRLTRIGTPEEAAASSDWDQISASFTGVRGAGYVAWYPIATDAANLSEGNSPFDVLGRWKKREAESGMNVLFESTQDAVLLFSGYPNGFVMPHPEGIIKMGDFSMPRFGDNVPTFVCGNYKKLDVLISSIAYLPGKERAAQSYLELLGKLDSLPGGYEKGGIRVVELPEPDAAPFATQGMVLMSLKGTVSEQDRLTLVYALAREEARSTHPWISEGLAHLAQVIDIEQQQGRPAALAYLQAHQSMLVDLEVHHPSPDNSPFRDDLPAKRRSLVDTTDEIYLQNKSMWVWSMLRDMVGPSLGIVFFSYHAADDRSSSYV